MPSSNDKARAIATRIECERVATGIKDETVLLKPDEVDIVLRALNGFFLTVGTRIKVRMPAQRDANEELLRLQCVQISGGALETAKDIYNWVTRNEQTI